MEGRVDDMAEMKPMTEEEYLVRLNAALGALTVLSEDQRSFPRNCSNFEFLNRHAMKEVERLIWYIKELGTELRTDEG